MFSFLNFTLFFIIHHQIFQNEINKRKGDNITIIVSRSLKFQGNVSLADDYDVRMPEERREAKHFYDLIRRGKAQIINPSSFKIISYISLTLSPVISLSFSMLGHRSNVMMVKRQVT